MPIYMDTHEKTELSEELRTAVTERIRTGEKDAHGVIDRGIVVDTVDHRLHCVLEAPDTEAIVRHHESLDVPIERETIHEADVVLR